MPAGPKVIDSLQSVADSLRRGERGSWGTGSPSHAGATPSKDAQPSPSPLWLDLQIHLVWRLPIWIYTPARTRATPAFPKSQVCTQEFTTLYHKVAVVLKKISAFLSSFVTISLFLVKNQRFERPDRRVVLRRRAVVRYAGALGEG